MELNPNQQRFVKEYPLDLNATKAAIRAGYSENGASVQGTRLLANANIKLALAKVLQKRAEKTEINAEYVLRQADVLLQRCLQQEPVMKKNEQGELVETGVWKFDSAGAGKALELLGKHVNVQAFKDKIEHTGEGGSPLNIQINFIKGKE